MDQTKKKSGRLEGKTETVKFNRPRGKNRYDGKKMGHLCFARKSCAPIGTWIRRKEPVSPSEIMGEGALG